MRRLHVTLLEILIVISILTLVSGVIGVNVRRAFIEQRFRTEVDLMVDTLRLAQDLMLILDTNTRVFVKEAPGGKGIEYWLEVEEEIPQQWNSIIKHSRRLLKGTRFINFAEEGPFPPSEGELEMRFLSGGSLMSRGALRMSSHEKFDSPEAFTRVICLEGYPHPIFSIPEYDKRIECGDKESAEFNNQLTYYTTQEIFEDAALNQQTSEGEEASSSEPSHEEEETESP